MIILNLRIKSITTNWVRLLGSKLAPSVANIFISRLKEEMSSEHHLDPLV